MSEYVRLFNESFPLKTIKLKTKKTAIDRSEYTVCVFLDLSKAFDNLDIQYFCQN